MYDASFGVVTTESANAGRRFRAHPALAVPTPKPSVQEPGS